MVERPDRDVHAQQLDLPGSIGQLHILRHSDLDVLARVSFSYTCATERAECLDIEGIEHANIGARSILYGQIKRLILENAVTA